jgi:glycogen debranching enzyme
LLADDMWSGWGIRTLSADHPGYNPFSYHTGSVWPHDNATIAAGLRAYGLDREAARIAKGMFDAAERIQGSRLPELFAGSPRQEGGFPVQYLGANVPQAWAAGAILRLVMVLAGIDARSDRTGSRLLVEPALPDWLPDLTLRGLRVGRGAVTVHLHDGTAEVASNTSGYRVAPAGATRRAHR